MKVPKSENSRRKYSLVYGINKFFILISFIYLNSFPLSAEEKNNPLDLNKLTNLDEYRINNKGINPPNENAIESNDNDKKIKWKIIKNENHKSEQIDWKPVSDKNKYLIESKGYKYRINNAYEALYEEGLDLKLLDLGKAVPTSQTLDEDELRFKVGQVSTLKEGYAKGSGNQNYIGEINYGLRDDLLFTVFFSDADDPLTKRINNLSTQPENRWSNYGSSIKWRFFKKSSFEIAFEGSLENWLVESGGCAGNQCSYNTSNIFNSETSIVENNNLIGSIALPLGYKKSKNLEFSITPRLTYLPNSQGNEYGSGNFYGNNTGIGFGAFYKPFKRVKAYTSYYIPTGKSKNSFDKDLNFNKSSIYTAGLNYSLDSKIAFQSYLSNGFGLTPATSILSIPSSKETLVGFNLIYTPSNIDRYYEEEIKRRYKKRIFDGLSVSNSGFINSDEYNIQTSIDQTGNWHLKYKRGLSQRFIADLIAGSVGKDNKTTSNYKIYSSPGNKYLRGGATAILFTEENNNIFTSAIRGSFGRVMEENKHGYFFTEMINSFSFSENLTFNLNPKMAVSGSGESSGLGTSLNWEILKGIIVMPEVNIPIHDSQANTTFAIRFVPGNKERYLDLYTSNAYSFIDIGQLMKRKENTIGINIGTLF